ncbi:MAG: tetratricopeptide repeat protein [Planctomycetes bacterium]|nr:tetratricopeptide repeat protein [Planctomycetota bacterium]
MDEASWELQEGLILQSRGLLDEAIERFDAVLARDPGNSLVWFYKANSLVDLDRDEEALRCFRESLAIDGNNYDAWNNLGYALKKLERLEESLPCFDRALALSPGNDAAWRNRADVLGGLGRLAEALESIDRAIDLDLANAAYWSVKGQWLHASGRFGESLSCADRALSIDVKNPVLWVNKGTALMDMDEFERALDCWEELTRIHPDEPWGWIQKGICLLQLEREAKALRAFEKANLLSPENPEAWHGKGNCLEALGRPAEALDCYEKALSLAPEDAGAWFAKGFCLLGMEREEEALPCLSAAVEKDPGFAKAWHAKGLAEVAVGRYAPAAASLRRFLSLSNPDDWGETFHGARDMLRKLESLDDVESGVGEEPPGAGPGPLPSGESVAQAIERVFGPAPHPVPDGTAAPAYRPYASIDPGPEQVRRREVGSRVLVVRYRHGSHTNPELLDDMAEELLDAAASHGGEEKGLQDGLRIGFGWMPITLRGQGPELALCEPDFEGDPRVDLCEDVSATLQVSVMHALVAELAGVSPIEARCWQTVLVARGAIEQEFVVMHRNEEPTDEHSGWYVGPLDPREIDRVAANKDYELLPGFEILKLRPHLVKAMCLPVQYMAYFRGDRITRITDAEDNEVFSTGEPWLPDKASEILDRKIGGEERKTKKRGPRSWPGRKRKRRPEAP